ncbi:MAG: hypothetical protein ABJC39_08650 [Chloroflexota bacterium]
MSRLSVAQRRHDPYWDTDGAGARHVRTKQRAIRMVVWLVIVVALAIVATRLPSIDPEYLTSGSGRPILAASLFTILGAAALLALARIRHVTRN